jgi:hypothetical protein
LRVARCRQVPLFPAVPVRTVSAFGTATWTACYTACPTCPTAPPALQIAIEMLESGKVDAVVCVQSDENDRFTPKPVGEGGSWVCGWGACSRCGSC